MNSNIDYEKVRQVVNKATKAMQEDLIEPVEYFRDTGKLTEKSIQEAIELNATHMLYAFHDWCRSTPFKNGRVHLFEEWYKENKK